MPIWSGSVLGFGFSKTAVAIGVTDGGMGDARVRRAGISRRRA